MSVSLTPLLPAVNFSTTTVAILAVAGVLIVLYVTIKSAQIVLTMLSGRVYYGGQSWDRDTYETALREVKQRSRAGELVDASSRREIAKYEGTRQPRSRSSRISSNRV